MAAPGQSDYPRSSEDDAEILKEITDNIKKSRSRRTQWRLQAREDYDFYAGNQWSEEDAAVLREQERPVVVFNRIIKIINAVSGYEIQNRQEARYYPRNIDINQQDPNALTDTGYAEELTEAVKWAKDQTHSEDEESEAFLDKLICGEGWTDTVMDYDENPRGMIKQERIDPLMMDVDPESTKQNYEDAKWVAYTRDLTRKEIKELFPDLDMAELYVGSFNTADPGILVHDADRDAFYENDYSFEINPNPNTIPVTKYQCVKKKKVRLLLTPDGNQIEISDRKYRAAKSLIESMALKTVEFDKNIYKQYIVVGSMIAERFVLDTNHFTLRCQTGLRDRNNKQWFGLVRITKDPQRWANKWLSQIQYIINANNKGGVFVEGDAPANFREFEEDYSKPNAILKVNPGKMAGIQERQPLQFPGGSDKLLQYAIEAISDTSGVSLELLGMASRNQPIGLEESRKESGIAVLAVFFDSLRRYRKIQARIMADYVREYIADGRLIRVLGQNGEKYMPLLKDKMAFEYDVEIDDAPSSPRVKERTFTVVLKLVEYAIQMGVPVPPEVFDYAPLPNDLAQKWKQMIVEQSQPSPEQQQAQQQQQMYQQMKALLDLQKDRTDIEKTESEIDKNSAQAVKDISVGQEQSALAMQKFGAQGFEQYLAEQEAMASHQRGVMDIELEHRRETLDKQLEHLRESMKIDSGQQEQPQQPQIPEGLLPQ